jgi:ribosomal protein S18 acetylase RimI-like enzyme
MHVRSLAFRTDLALLTLGGSEVEDRGDHLVVRTEANPTFHWGNFFLLASPPAADEVPDLLAAYDAELPDSLHRAFGVDGTTDQWDAVSPLVAAGLEPYPGAVMTATQVHEPPRPSAEATYRMLVSDDDWAQRVEVSLACNSEYPREEFLTYARRKAASERDLVRAGHGAWWGAFLGDRLASGMGLFAAGDGLARFQSVETHPDFRGRGLAGTLIHRVSRFGYDDLGARTLVMVADPGYHAIRIYRSVGFAETEVQTQLQRVSRTA